MSNEFSIQKMFASAVDRYGVNDDKKNIEKQTRPVSAEEHYRNLLGAQLGNTANTAASRVP